MDEVARVDVDGTARLSERTRAFIATFIVVGGGALVAAAWWSRLPTAPNDPSILITPTFALMSGVAGYYFGVRGVDRAQQAAIQSGLEKTLAGQELSGVVEELEARIARSEPLVDGYRQILEAAEADPALKAKVPALTRGMDE
ncbi:MAG TPA: hypothetical protein VI997_00470 [Candidatus Thermoplasmatota archaeon]|nr:hypothetical protein [Candidatus Thermoplasmatota archaeon]